MRSLLKILDEFDKKRSEQIHKMKTTWFLETCLWFPGNAFQPKIVPLLVLFQAYAMSACEKELSRVDVSEMTPEQQLDYSPGFHMLYYSINIFLLLIVTTILKDFWGRPRPTAPAQSEKCARVSDLRSKESNCSMPSGDAAQAALFSFVSMNCFPTATMMMGGPLGSA